jgi:hypothetical protein
MDSEAGPKKFKKNIADCRSDHSDSKVGSCEYVGERPGQNVSAAPRRSAQILPLRGLNRTGKQKRDLDKHSPTVLFHGVPDYNGFLLSSADSRTIRRAFWLLSTNLHLWVVKVAPISMSMSISKGALDLNLPLQRSQTPMAGGVRFPIRSLRFGMAHSISHPNPEMTKVHDLSCFL